MRPTACSDCVPEKSELEAPGMSKREFDEFVRTIEARESSDEPMSLRDIEKFQPKEKAQPRNS
jgi:hypothetical protein